MTKYQPVVIDKRKGSNASRAFHMAAEGRTYAEIAQSLGITRQAARQGVARYAKDYMTREGDSVTQVALAVERLRMLVADARALIENDPSPAAIRAAISVEERISRLLGMDKPTRLQLVDPSEDELARFVAEWAAATGHEPAPTVDIFAITEGEPEEPQALIVFPAPEEHG